MKRIFVCIGFLVAVMSLSAQQSNDYGFFLGMAQEHIHTILPVPVPGTSRAAAGAYYRYNFNPRYAMHFGARLGLGASANLLQQLDLYGVVEFNFLPMNPRKKPPQMSTFIGTGLGFYQQTLAIPFDLGVKYQVTPRLGMTVEWDLRKLPFKSNPMLQGDAGIPEKILSNWHSFIGVTLGYTILKTCKTCPFYRATRRK